MPRKHRIWYPGATYHIMCRGNHRHDIFRDDEDRIFYLTTLRQAQKHYPYTLHSYCLMTNHIHLQLETHQLEVGQVMKRINMVYAIYFNRKYHFVGHLFQGRYRSELIEKDDYQLEISKYIHLNPVRANMVERPLDYPWSSYGFYMEEREDALIKTGKILDYFSPPRVERYRKYVES
ncbi:transposase [Ammoniphilus sp. CFH 90114]|uniref:transposase n=1 Tax=Ammoniphilus sp. CFH 90114 TaxID=2493665 RepID=UPI00100DCF02|nr:transposase [Ammoniphilus sp. CFH 90114]RXT02762.1 transposase [Ammoniphilus sp. CFH 90114]